jgi:hypothetical protein
MRAAFLPPPFAPPLRDDALLSFLPRPLPLFFPAASFVHGGPSATLRFFAAYTTLLITFLDLLRFPFLFGRVSLFASIKSSPVCFLDKQNAFDVLAEFILQATSSYARHAFIRR